MTGLVSCSNLTESQIFANIFCSPGNEQDIAVYSVLNHDVVRLHIVSPSYIFHSSLRKDQET